MSAFQPPYTIDTLLQIMAQLRDPQHGCPWDLRQSFATLVPHSIEEVYEVAEAVRLNDHDELRLELGDLLFQVIFFAQIAKENQQFDFAAIIDGLCEKLLRRHPHVFGRAEFTDEAQVNSNWEAEKAKERADKKAQSVLDDVPLALPALSRAQKLQKRAANIGFDWDNAQQVMDKVAEEFEEVHQAQQDDNAEAVAEEIGDLLFACVNLARKHGFDSETLLRKASEKFERRFRQVEQRASDSNKSISEHSLDELENYWIEVKAQEQSR